MISKPGKPCGKLAVCRAVLSHERRNRSPRQHVSICFLHALQPISYLLSLPPLAPPESQCLSKDKTTERENPAVKEFPAMDWATALLVFSATLSSFLLLQCLCCLIFCGKTFRKKRYTKNADPDSRDSLQDAKSPLRIPNAVVPLPPASPPPPQEQEPFEVNEVDAKTIVLFFP